MPLYVCNAVQGTLSGSAKVRIAQDITDTHCAITNALPNNVHVFFFEDAPKQPVHGKRIFLLGTIRGGLADGEKAELIGRVKDAIHVNAGVPLGEIIADTVDVPASWLMEGGHILLEPGEEDVWLQTRRQIVYLD